MFNDTRGYIRPFFLALIYGVVTIAFIIFVNVTIDASFVIRPQHMEMAQLALKGNVVAQPQNYNERVYQYCIVSNMSSIPETIVIGSSRGMFVGVEVTGYDSIYNNCVSGACVEDYYALLGLYYERFNRLPNRVIVEVSPWILYRDNPEGRWQEAEIYKNSALSFYRIVNGVDLQISKSVKTENPYISLPYFQYNVIQFKKNGFKTPSEEARISMDSSEAADFPDGTIRYDATLEKKNEERLKGVLATSGALDYQGSDNMMGVDDIKYGSFVNMIDFLQKQGIEVIIWMEPFSPIQCKYSFDENLNPGFFLAEKYIRELSQKRNIDVRGGYDSREWGLTDDQYIDSMHLDKEGVKFVWNSKR